MHLRTRLLPALLAASLALAGLTACGGSDPSGDIVAQVGNMTVTRSTLNHWMSTLLGGDFNENVGGRAPRDLVSDPADYPACIAAIEHIGPPKSTGGHGPAEARAAVESECHALHQAMVQQTLSYLITGLWVEGEATAYGIKLSPSELQRAYQTIKAREFHNEAAFHALLTNREWSLADYMYLIRRDTLMAKLNEQREKAVRQNIKGHAVALQRAVLELYAEEGKKWLATTSCKPAYVIPDCKQYKGPRAAAESAPSPDALLETIVGSR